jgi:proteic killer suppression protein/toxin YoeB
LNDVLHSKGLLCKAIGFDLARQIKKRYDQIRAFNSFYGFQQSGYGRVESLSGNLKGYYSVRLSSNYRLIIKPKSVDLSAYSLKECDTVIIKGVIDYHGRGNNWLIP